MSEASDILRERARDATAEELDAVERERREAGQRQQEQRLWEEAARKR